MEKEKKRVRKVKKDGFLNLIVIDNYCLLRSSAKTVVAKLARVFVKKLKRRARFSF